MLLREDGLVVIQTLCY